MEVTAQTPAELLAAALRGDAARPLITFYDDATGERVELSVVTFDNWVAKTAGFLADGLGIEPGDRVALLLPAHWQALAWACACWTVGACVVLDSGAAGPDADVRVAVAGPDTLPLAQQMNADDVVGLALRPLGGRFVGDVPAGVLDYAVEAPGYPDRFVPIMRPAPDEPALEHEAVVHTLAGLIERAGHRAEQLGADQGSRLLVAADDLAVALSDALLVPLVVGGSAVLVRHEDAAGRPARLAAERVTVVAST